MLFCDFDGPIVDVSERYYRTYRLGLSALQTIYQTQHGKDLPIEPLTKKQFWQMKQTRVPDAEIAARSGLPDDAIEPFLQQVAQLVNHPHLLRWDTLQLDAAQAIQQIKQSGVRLVLVTLRQPEQVQAFLEAHSLSQHVDQIFGASDARAAHLNRVEQKVALLQQAIAAQQALGFATHNAWMVGDTEADVIAGQRAGIQTVALTCGIRSQARLTQLNPTKLTATLLQSVQLVLTGRVLQVA
ncbi:MAG: HAD family hydrolase [Leptolyngbya sp. SIO4C1]|nr:HAD family hydrolase [Leptolyngbya sp. SIO4C1]